MKVKVKMNKKTHRRSAGLGGAGVGGGGFEPGQGETLNYTQQDAKTGTSVRTQQSGQDELKTNTNLATFVSKSFSGVKKSSRK